jgi:hypothetical protein
MDTRAVEMRPLQTGSALCSKCDELVFSCHASDWEHAAGTVYEVQCSARAGCQFCAFLNLALDLDLQVQKQGAKWAHDTVVILHQPALTHDIKISPQSEEPNKSEASLSVDYCLNSKCSNH